jgi:hypothetical protein
MLRPHEVFPDQLEARLDAMTGEIALGVSPPATATPACTLPAAALCDCGSWPGT